MARQNIFELAASGNNMQAETERLLRLFERETIVAIGLSEYTLRGFVDAYVFAHWKQSGHFIDVSDYLSTIHYPTLERLAYSYIDDHLTLIELVYNFWMIAFWYIRDRRIDGARREFTLLKTMMDDLLAKYNQKAIVDEKKQQVLIVEDKPEVTAAAEIASPQIGMMILRYNHRTLKGDLEAKKAILFALGSELEPKRPQLNQIDSMLESDIFFALNNLNIRHNNCSPNDRFYNETVAQMKKGELENWYDELYQMILLANLELDNADRKKRIKKLKKTINRA